MVLAWSAVPLPAQAASPVLLRYPYLTDVTGSWAMVNLATDTQTPAPVVSWGLASGDCSNPAQSVTATFVTAFLTNDKQFKAQLTGLQPNTAYCYRVAQAGVDLLGSAPVFTSALASGASDPFTFAVIGDWGAGTTDESKVISQIAAAQPSFVVTVGDNVYNSGTQTEYGDINGGNAFAPQYWPQIGRTTPMFAAEGNHGFSGSLPYFQNWPMDSTVAACAAAGCKYVRETYCCVGTLGTSTKSYPSAWYAFDWGNSRFYILEGAWGDSTGGYQGDFQGRWNGPVAGCAPCGTEQTWLANDLTTHSAAHKFAFFHYPLHSDNGSQSTDTYLDGPGGLEGLLASNGVHIVFNGHAHDYERNYPQIPGSPMLSYISGGGGDPLGGISGHSAFDAYSKAVFHYLKVGVSGGTVTVTPIDENGATFDVQTYTFSGNPPANDFSITASPSSASVLQGQSATATVSTSVTSGSTQTVALSASGMPAGATASFSPSSVSAGGSSTLTLSTSTSTPAGSYPITITGAGASATHTTSIVLTVTAPDDFSISAAPSNVSVFQGQSTTSTISTAVTNGSPQAVTLTASGLPAGATASFSPDTVTAGGSSTLTVSSSSTTPSGTYTLTITGAGASVTHTTSISLTVTGPSSGPAFVQAAGASETASSTSLSATFSVASQPGHLLVLSASVYTGATNQITRVSDSAGNTWTKVGAYFVAGHNSDGEIWYAANANAATTVTVTVASATTIAIEVMEFSGVAAVNPVDASTGTSNTGTSASSGSVTPTAATDLAVGFVGGHSSTQAVTVTTPGYSTQPQQTSSNAGSTPVSVVAGYSVLSSATAQSFSGTFTSTMYWAAAVVLFRSA